MKGYKTNIQELLDHKDFQTLLFSGLQHKIMNVDDAHHLRFFSINMVNQQGAMVTKE